jgi:hypothetical protein
MEYRKFKPQRESKQFSFVEPGVAIQIAMIIVAVLFLYPSPKEIQKGCFETVQLHKTRNNVLYIGATLFSAVALHPFVAVTLVIIGIQCQQPQNTCILVQGLCATSSQSSI